MENVRRNTLVLEIIHLEIKSTIDRDSLVGYEDPVPEIKTTYSMVRHSVKGSMVTRYWASSLPPKNSLRALSRLSYEGGLMTHQTLYCMFCLRKALHLVMNHSVHLIELMLANSPQEYYRALFSCDIHSFTSRGTA